MQLSKFDLNLFTVFDAIYREQGITPASKRLHLSQPAISHALGRLRELLNDPLFERRGNDMVPTPFARSLAATVSGSLGALQQVLHRAGQFDPASSQRDFTIAVRESHELSFLPMLLARVVREAPGVDINVVRAERREFEEDMEAGEIDVAIDIALPLSQNVRRERLSAEPIVVMARQGHPEISGALSLETYLASEHVLVTGRRHGGGHEDIALGRLGMSRRVRLRCQQHAAASEVVSQSDLLVTMASGQAALVNRDKKNQVLPFPVEIPPFEFFLYWHANADEDPANRWFREKMVQAYKREP